MDLEPEEADHDVQGGVEEGGGGGDGEAPGRHLHWTKGGVTWALGRHAETPELNSS